MGLARHQALRMDDHLKATVAERRQTDCAANAAVILFTSFALTVVSADALIGTHSSAAAAASTNELRNLVIYPLPQIWEHHPLLSHDVVSHHPTPDLGSRCPWTPRHLSHMSVPPHLYTMPDLYLLPALSKCGYDGCSQPLTTITKVLDLSPEPGSSMRS